MSASNFVFNKDRTELFIKGDYEPYLGGMGKFYFDGLKEHASTEDLIAQIDARTDEHQSYKELFQRSVKLAQYLRDSGIKPGDVIAMCSYNHLNATVALTATAYIGAILAPTDPILTQSDTKYLLEMVKPKIVFVAEGCEELIAGIALPAKIIAFANNTKYESFEQIMKSTKFCIDFVPHFVEDLNETTNILFSSGSTGMPKGIKLSHHYFSAYLQSVKSMAAESKIVFLNYASFYWITSVINLSISIKCKSARLLCRQFNRDNHWSIIEKYKVNTIVLSNTYATEAVSSLNEKMKLSELRKIIIVGGFVNETVVQEYRRKLPNVIVGAAYGLTECGLVTQCERDGDLKSSGKPIPSNQTIKVVDPKSEETLPLNKVGELRIKRNYQMTGYYNLNSSDAWDSQGFLKTGDLGYLDDECNLFIVDRIKEMFKYRSWHVIPAKIEEVLASKPEILHAVVIGKPTNNEDENHAMAIVCLKVGASGDAKDIERYANERLGDIDQIRAGVHIVALDDFFFTSTGKINRHRMKKTYTAQFL